MKISSASIRVEYTKILEHIYMAELKRMVSGKGGEKILVSMPTQRYDVLSGRIRNLFVGIISMELDGIWNSQWNADMVIFLRH